MAEPKITLARFSGVLAIHFSQQSGNLNDPIKGSRGTMKKVEALKSELMQLAREDFDFIEHLVNYKKKAEFIDRHDRRVVVLSPCAAQRHDRLRAKPISSEQAALILAKSGL